MTRHIKGLAMWEGCRCLYLPETHLAGTATAVTPSACSGTQLHTHSLGLCDDKNLSLNGTAVLGDRKMSVSLLPVTSALNPTQLFLGHSNPKIKAPCHITLLPCGCSQFPSQTLSVRLSQGQSKHTWCNEKLIPFLHKYHISLLLVLHRFSSEDPRL